MGPQKHKINLESVRVAKLVLSSQNPWSLSQDRAVIYGRPLIPIRAVGVDSSQWGLRDGDCLFVIRTRLDNNGIGVTCTPRQRHTKRHQQQKLEFVNFHLICSCFLTGKWIGGFLVQNLKCLRLIILSFEVQKQMTDYLSTNWSVGLVNV